MKMDNSKLNSTEEISMYILNFLDSSLLNES